MKTQTTHKHTHKNTSIFICCLFTHKCLWTGVWSPMRACMRGALTQYRRNWLKTQGTRVHKAPIAQSKNHCLVQARFFSDPRVEGLNPLLHPGAAYAARPHRRWGYLNTRAMGAIDIRNVLQVSKWFLIVFFPSSYRAGAGPFPFWPSSSESRKAQEMGITS